MHIQFINRNDNKTSGFMPLKFELKSEESNSYEAQFLIDNFEKFQAVSGELTYNLNNTKSTLQFKLPFSSSFFFFEKENTIENYSKLAKDIQFSSRKKIPYNENFKDIISVSNEISKVLHLYTVSNNKNITFHMYGVSIQNHHLMVSLSGKSEKDEFIIDLKCSSEALVKSLFSEVEKIFKKKESKN
jgi:hypothetical protein